MESVTQSISSEITAIESFNQAGRYPLEASREPYYSHVLHHSNDMHLNESWAQPLGSVPTETYEVFLQYAHTHPLMEPFQRTGLSTPLKVSDFLSTRQFRQTPLYNEFYRRIGVEYQMITGLPVSPSNTLTLTVLRNRKDFTERDRRLLSALRPHLLAACRNALAFTHLDLARMVAGSPSERLGMGVIVLDMDGKIQLMGSQARTLLAMYFGVRPQQHELLPEEVERWLRRQISGDKVGQEAKPPYPPLEVRGPGAGLRIRLFQNDAAEQKVLLLEEKGHTASTGSEFEALGLTTREAEVLGWVANGKTNPEVAQLCNVRLRTIEKHLEHVYQKLGVETRTAAARVVLEFLYHRHDH
jgi:DNA-binding CsgD family transcriptional regulator